MGGRKNGGGKRNKGVDGREDEYGDEQTSSTIGGVGDVTYLSPFWEETARK